jgi:hypothetical protein
VIERLALRDRALYALYADEKSVCYFADTSHRCGYQLEVVRRDGYYWLLSYAITVRAGEP